MVSLVFMDFSFPLAQDYTPQSAGNGSTIAVPARREPGFGEIAGCPILALLGWGVPAGDAAGGGDTGGGDCQADGIHGEDGVPDGAGGTEAEHFAGAAGTDGAGGGVRSGVWAGSVGAVAGGSGDGVGGAGGLEEAVYGEKAGLAALAELERGAGRHGRRDWKDGGERTGEPTLSALSLLLVVRRARLILCNWRGGSCGVLAIGCGENGLGARSGRMSQ